MLVGGGRFFGRVRGKRGEGHARKRNRFALRGGGVVGADDSARRHAVQHPVARRARRLRRAVGPALLRRLRQRDQKRRLGDRQPARLLGEIGERGRAHAFQIAAERRDRHIAVENARLADLMLDLGRPRDLPELGGERALGPRLDQAGDLHGKRRTAGDDMAAKKPLSGRAQKGARIDAAVLIEPPVLIGDQHRKIARVDLMGRRRQAPAPIGQGEGPEQPPLAIDDDGRALARGHEVDRPEARGIARPENRRREAGDEDERHRGGEREPEEADEGHARPHPNLLPPAGEGERPLSRWRERARVRAPHFAVTSSSPNAVRP